MLRPSAQSSSAASSGVSDTHLLELAWILCRTEAIERSSLWTQATSSQYGSREISECEEGGSRVSREIEVIMFSSFTLLFSSWIWWLKEVSNETAISIFCSLVIIQMVWGMGLVRAACAVSQSEVLTSPPRLHWPGVSSSSPRVWSGCCHRAFHCLTLRERENCGIQSVAGLPSTTLVGICFHNFRVLENQNTFPPTPSPQFGEPMFSVCVWNGRGNREGRGTSGVDHTRFGGVDSIHHPAGGRSINFASSWAVLPHTSIHEIRERCASSFNRQILWAWRRGASVKSSTCLRKRSIDFCRARLKSEIVAADAAAASPSL